jgi:hypothetical protein
MFLPRLSGGVVRSSFPRHSAMRRPPPPPGRHCVPDNACASGWSEIICFRAGNCEDTGRCCEWSCTECGAPGSVFPWAKYCCLLDG